MLNITQYMITVELTIIVIYLKDWLPYQINHHCDLFKRLTAIPNECEALKLFRIFFKWTQFHSFMDFNIICTYKWLTLDFICNILLSMTNCDVQVSGWSAGCAAPTLTPSAQIRLTTRLFRSRTASRKRACPTCPASNPPCVGRSDKKVLQFNLYIYRVIVNELYMKRVNEIYCQFHTEFCCSTGFGHLVVISDWTCWGFSHLRIPHWIVIKYFWAEFACV